MSSDIDDNVVTDSSDDADRKPSKTPAKTPAKSKKTNPGTIVSEPKYTPAKVHKVQSTSSMKSIDHLLQLRVELEKQKQQSRDEKLKAEDQQHKFDRAKEILKLDGISADLKAAAEAVLLKALQ